MNLCPADIYYSQDTIRRHLGDGRTIFEILDECQDDPDAIDHIEMIRVCKVGHRWFSLDNRRLWIFKKLWQRGYLETLTVKVVHFIPDYKLTTTSGGKYVQIL